MKKTMAKKIEKLPDGVTVYATTPEKIGLQAVRNGERATCCRRVEVKDDGAIGEYYHRGTHWYWRGGREATWSAADTESMALNRVLLAARLVGVEADAQKFHLPAGVTLDRDIADTAAQAEHYTIIRKGAERLGWFFKDSRESNAAPWAPWVWSSADGRSGHCENENACIRHILTPPPTTAPPPTPPAPPLPDIAFAELALHEIVQAAIEDARNGKPALLRSLLHALFEILKTSPTPEWLTKLLPTIVGIGLPAIAMWSALKNNVGRKP